MGAVGRGGCKGVHLYAPPRFQLKVMCATMWVKCDGRILSGVVNRFMVRAPFQSFCNKSHSLVCILQHFTRISSFDTFSRLTYMYVIILTRSVCRASFLGVNDLYNTYFTEQGSHRTAYFCQCLSFKYLGCPTPLTTNLVKSFNPTTGTLDPFADNDLPPVTFRTCLRILVSQS